MTNSDQYTSTHWEKISGSLDQGQVFNTMRDTPYYRDAVYPQFSRGEYLRRFAALRAKMQEQDLDVVICPGGPSHWSFGGGMLWLSGHWEWHSLAAYVVFPRDGEPTLIYGMGGTHIEAVRREVSVAISDVRSSRGGLYGVVMAERIAELGYDKGPIHSEEELDCVRHAGTLCTNAMQAIAERAKPGATEADLRAAAGSAILEGGGDIDFLIIGSTPMAAPAMVFGNPRPSQRELSSGDMILMELAAGYRGYSAQIGQPICLGAPSDPVQQFWDEIAKPGYLKIIDTISPGRPLADMRQAAGIFREKGVQSRPIVMHGIDFVSDGPHVFVERTASKPFEETFKPGMVLMPEPNPISADGRMGMFVGHTFIVTEDGKECVDDWPLELTVV